MEQVRPVALGESSRGVSLGERVRNHFRNNARLYGAVGAAAFGAAGAAGVGYAGHAIGHRSGLEKGVAQGTQSAVTRLYEGGFMRK